MGDIRFIMIGVALVFAGFIVLGVLGDAYQAASIEADEFGTCHNYSDDSEPVITSCAAKTGEQVAFFGAVVAIICGGAASLVKGVRGDWDSRVKPEEMVGPGRNGHDGDSDGKADNARDGVGRADGENRDA